MISRNPVDIWKYGLVILTCSVARVPAAGDVGGAHLALAALHHAARVPRAACNRICHHIALTRGKCGHRGAYSKLRISSYSSEFHCLALKFKESL